MVSNRIKAGWLMCVCASLAACAESTPKPRVAMIGPAAEQDQSGQTGPATGATTRLGTGSASTSFVVTAGNILLGEAGASLGISLDGAVASTAVLDGAVTGVLQDTGQTLVELTNGASLLLNDTGGNVGDVLAIDAASGQVIAGPGALVGSQALPASPTAAGGATNLAGTSGAATSATLSATGTASPASTAVGSIGSTVTTTLGTPGLGCC